MSLQFGDFELDQEQRQLLRAGQAVPLEPKAYELLSLLLKRRPRALSRAQIRDVVWPGVFISESTLGVAVNSIRQALDDDARKPRFIRTVRGFGYAFCGDARDTAEGPAPPEGGAARVAEARPYPGLSAFTEADAAFFFGREDEVAALWTKVRRQPLLAVIGPSGVGKTSFLRAGVIAGRPDGWRAALTTPGSSPVFSLAQALLPGLAGDAQAMAELLEGVRKLGSDGEPDRVASAVRRWRHGSAEALVVLDQFEELFTLNPPEVQARFALLLERLAAEGDVHVLLSLRDDFLFRCSEQDGLRPVFHDLTPLTPPSPQALRRAVVEPAARQGVRFEDDALVEEMVATVGEERGALPLLAFAVSRLWEERDRERRLLTRASYERIGGVVGALAHHAEEALTWLGPEWEGAVREIFRNLVTAEGTRAACEREELLSVFGEGREAAAAVLDVLVDARLLTEYEGSDAARPVGGTEDEVVPLRTSRRRVEIVHESLLTHWPRLVRWQTQDADGALLRDQLRQAAHLWEGKGRPDDLLWTGASYLEYRAWRARYSGGVSAVEDGFAKAMSARAHRQRRRRRVAAMAALAAAIAVAVGMSALWRRSEAARETAQSETRRAEANALLALGQIQMEEFPTAALAYALKSLELADTEDGRLFALRALQVAPAAFFAPAGLGDGLEAGAPAFSPDGAWLAVGGMRKMQLLARDGSAPVVVDERPTAALIPIAPVFSPSGSVLLTAGSGLVRAFSFPHLVPLWQGNGDPGFSVFLMRGAPFTLTEKASDTDTPTWLLRQWDETTGRSRLIGAVEGRGDVDPSGRYYAYAAGRRVLARDIESWESTRVLAEGDAEIQDVAVSPDGEAVAATDAAGEILVWPTRAPSSPPERLPAEGTPWVMFDSSGRRLAAIGGKSQRLIVRVWDRVAPPSAVPVELRRNDMPFHGGLAFDPAGRWVVSTYLNDTAFWPLRDSDARVLEGHENLVQDLAFTPDGGRLLSASGDGTLKAWPLSRSLGVEPSVLARRLASFPLLALDPSSPRVAVCGDSGVLIVPIDGGPTRRLMGLPALASAVAFSPDGRFVAAAAFYGPRVEKMIHVWDLDSGTASSFGPVPGAGEGFEGGVAALSFLSPDRVVASLFAAGGGDIPMGDVVLDLRDGQMRVIEWSEGSGTRHMPSPGTLVVSRDGTFALGIRALQEREAFAESGGAPWPPTQLVRLSFEDREVTPVPSHGASVLAVALDPSQTRLATGSMDGTVRIGPLSGGDPHVFLGHEGMVRAVRFSPDGRWLASAGEDGRIRLWPVPDVSKTPLHKRPLEDLLSTLRSCTNLRVAPNRRSPGGYELVRDPFPGWARVPEC